MRLTATLALLAAACSSSSPEESGEPPGTTGTPIPEWACTGESALFALLDASASGDDLVVEVTYNACDPAPDSRFWLCWPSPQEFHETSAVQVVLEIEMEATDSSTCYNTIDDDVTLDLSPLSSWWKGAQGESSGEIDIALGASGLTVVYAF